MIFGQDLISYYQFGDRQKELDHAAECIKKSNNRRLLGDNNRIFDIDKYITNNVKREYARRAENERDERERTERDEWFGTLVTPVCVRCGKYTTG